MFGQILLNTASQEFLAWWVKPNFAIFFAEIWQKKCKICPKMLAWYVPHCNRKTLFFSKLSTKKIIFLFFQFCQMLCVGNAIRVFIWFFLGGCQRVPHSAELFSDRARFCLWPRSAKTGWSIFKHFGRFGAFFFWKCKKWFRGASWGFTLLNARFFNFLNKIFKKNLKIFFVNF